MPHPIVHIELSAKDHGEAGSWYADVFGWETQGFPEMDYTTASYGSDTTGLGFNPVGDENPAGRVLVYIGTDDLAASVAKVKEKGGEIVLESFEIPTVGTMAMFKDPTGNLMALMQAAPTE